MSIYLDENLIERIKEYILGAEERVGCRIPRSIVIRKLIRLGLDELTKEEKEDDNECE